MNDINLNTFDEYIKNICYLTFGFEPIVLVKSPKIGTLVVTLTGDDKECGYLMGEAAVNFKAIKQFLAIFGARHSMKTFLYIDFEYASNQTDS